VARRNNTTWYLAAITDWTPRTITIDLHFLEAGKTYNAEIIRDGINADIRAIDYRKELRTVQKGDRIVIDMAPGGGWIGKISSQELFKNL